MRLKEIMGFDHSITLAKANTLNVMFSNIVASEHNEMCWTWAANSLSVSFKMLWLLPILNYAVSGRKNK